VDREDCTFVYNVGDGRVACFACEFVGGGKLKNLEETGN
jgi:hypothetical protein